MASGSAALAAEMCKHNYNNAKYVDLVCVPSAVEMYGQKPHMYASAREWCNVMCM